MYRSYIEFPISWFFSHVIPKCEHGFAGDRSLICRNIHRKSLCNHIPFVDLLGGLGDVCDERSVPTLGCFSGESGHDIL